MTYTRSKKQKKQHARILVGSTLFVMIGAIIFYIYGYIPAAEQDKIHVRFKEALLQEDRSFFEETLEYQGETLTRAEAIRFMSWLNDEKRIRSDAIAEIASDRADQVTGMQATGLFRLIDTGNGRFGFSDYRIELLPQTIDVTSDVPLTNVWLDGERVGRIDEEDDSLMIERMPGRYDVKAVAVVEGETVSESEMIQLIEPTTIDYALMPETSEAIAGQFDLRRAELIEIEVEAQTGYELKTIDSLIGESKRQVIDLVGEPLDRREDEWAYERLELTFEDGKVDYVLIDLDKRPDDLIALLGEPNREKEHTLGTEWEYSQSFIESFFTFFGLETEKRFIERDEAMYLLIQ